MPILDLSYEQRIWDKGKYPAGVDEAGRGPLAGPVVAAAVILSKDNPIEGLDDSKKLSAARREVLFDEICEKSLAYSTSLVDPEEIDKINILNASIKAMEISVVNLNIKPDFLFIDGNKKTSLEMPQETIIKGDSKCQSIAAASIIAKVTRDKLMEELHIQYPEYNFKKHKGYPTKEHLESIRIYGPCPIHRKTFRGV